MAYILVQRSCMPTYRTKRKELLLLELSNKNYHFRRWLSQPMYNVELAAFEFPSEMERVIALSRS